MNKINQFKSGSDTLVIRTEKKKGNGVLPSMAGALDFKTSLEKFPYDVIFPTDISDVKRVQIKADLSAEEPYYTDIISGMRGEEKIFIIDENNNRDLRDDSIRIYRDMDWHSDDDLVKFNFRISNGIEVVRDSAWVRIGGMNGMLLFGKGEHLEGKFMVDEKKYVVVATDKNSTIDFVYRGFTSEIAVLAQNQTEKDTLFQWDILKKGEFLNLGGTYYKFDSITNNGDYITLIKERNFEDEIGIQVGMIAPEFTGISVTKDTIRSSDLHDKITVIANSCGCGGDTLSTQAYYEIKKAYGDRIHVLRLDSGIKSGKEGIQIDMEEKFNKGMYTKYRFMYCSRMCYVIDKNNRILDRFKVGDWNSHLPGLID
ncbi:hypothetical protein [Sinomicrobium sp. M5D2P17]